MNTLDEHGTCKSCNKDAQTQSIACWMCKVRFHVIKCDVDPMVQESLFKNQWPNIQNRWICVTFTCPMCQEDEKSKEAAVMSGRVRLLEESALKSNQQLDHITELLTNVLKKPENNPTPIIPSKKPTETPVLIVVEKQTEGEPVTNEQTQEMWSEVAKRATKEKAGVKKSFTNKAGQSVFVCDSEKSKEALLPHVQDIFTNRRINTPKPRLPTISVPFIHGKYTNDELLNVLRQQNDNNGMVFSQDNAQVLFSAPMKDKDNLHQAVIRVSEKLRESIELNDNRLNIGINSCPVYDRFFIKRCFQCQDFHHFQKDCKKAKVCALCSGNHDTTDCIIPQHEYQCINCIKAEGDDFNHAASSFHCPSYKSEQDKLKKSIHYYSKNH